VKKVNIKRLSPTHLALKYLKMYKGKYISFDQIYAFSPKFNKPSTLLRSLNTLVRMGFVTKQDSCYTITALGQASLYTIAREQPSREKA
jgi:predicted transcriptional regulator